MRAVSLSDSESDSDDERFGGGGGGDMARRIAARVAASRLRRSFVGSVSSYGSGSIAMSRVRTAFQRQLTDSNTNDAAANASCEHGAETVAARMESPEKEMHEEKEKTPEKTTASSCLPAATTVTFVDSECNTCDNTVTIDKHVFESMKEKQRAEDASESAGSAESVFLNVIVDAASATAPPPRVDPQLLESLETENAKLRASLEAHEQKASLLKNDRLLMSKQFQMIQCEREEMAAFARAMTARRECMAARIVSIGKERETLRRQLSEERVAAGEMKTRLAVVESRIESVVEGDVSSSTASTGGVVDASLSLEHGDIDDDDVDAAPLTEDEDVDRLRNLLLERRTRQKKLAEANALLQSKLKALTNSARTQQTESDIKLKSVEAECSRLREELAAMTTRADTNEALVAEAFASVTAAIDEAKTLKEEERSAQRPATPETKQVSHGGTDPKTPVSTRCVETTTHEDDDMNGFADQPENHKEDSLRKRQIMLLASPLMADAGRHDYSAADPYGLGEASYEYKTSTDFEEDRKRWFEVMGQEGFQSPGTARLGQELLMEEHYFESLAFEKSLQQQEEEERLRAQVDELQKQLKSLEDSRDALLAEKQANSILFLEDDLLEENLIDDLDLDEEDVNDIIDIDSTGNHTEDDMPASATVGGHVSSSHNEKKADVDEEEKNTKPAATFSSLMKNFGENVEHFVTTMTSQGGGEKSEKSQKSRDSQRSASESRLPLSSISLNQASTAS